jgi:hypothetical protein
MGHILANEVQGTSLQSEEVTTKIVQLGGGVPASGCSSALTLHCPSDFSKEGECGR